MGARGPRSVLHARPSFPILVTPVAGPPNSAMVGLAKVNLVSSGPRCARVTGYPARQVNRWDRRSVDIVGDLRARTRGEVLAPRDGGYEAARAAYNALATGQPACIFRPADVPDIVAAVRWAVDVDLPIGVR
jgi:hypothetical protein